MEEWKWIDGYEGFYQISSFGRVKSFMWGREKILSDGKIANGYRQLILKGKAYRIHRLVAEAFIPNPENKPEVDHLDEDKSNNHVSNLEWVTRSQNVKRQHDKKWERIINRLSIKEE